MRSRERYLAPPVGLLRGIVGGARRLRSVWAAALLAVALVLVMSPFSAGAADPGQGAPVVAILFPLEDRVEWTDTFGAPREPGRVHQGNDLMAPKLTPLLAVQNGTVDWLNLTGKVSSYNNLPYYNILLHGDDGNDYFYVHLNNDSPGTDDGLGGPELAYAPGLTNGSKVEMGQVIGYVGDSGNAEDSPSHLHFEIHLGGYVARSAGQTRSPSAIDPYNSLKVAPTLAEWEAEGRPPLTTTTTRSTTTTTIPSTTTTTNPPNTIPSTTTTSTTVPIPPQCPFKDVKSRDWFFTDLMELYDRGVVQGSSTGWFHPYSLMTRAHFAAFLVRALAPDDLADVEAGEVVFEDVPPSYWAYKEILVAARLGLIKGVGDGARFEPAAAVSRAQMAVMICRALDQLAGSSGDWRQPESRVFRDVPQNYWAAKEIEAMRSLGILTGDADGYFWPERTTTRAQAVAVIARLLRLGVEGDRS